MPCLLLIPCLQVPVNIVMVGWVGDLMRLRRRDRGVLGMGLT